MACGWIEPLLAFIRELESKKIKTFGACFGHQAIALALGGTVETSAKGWGLGTGNTIFIEQAEWMVPPQNEMTLFAAHADQVTKLPNGATLLGGDVFCPIGAYRIGAHVFATEFHPEMTQDFVEALLDEMEADLDGPTVAKAKASLSKKAEGAKFAHWIVNFLDNPAT